MKVDDAIQMACEAIGENGLADEWRLRLNNRKTTLGICYHDSKRIELSRYLIELNEPDVVRDTILHEVAHALAGHEAGHGPKWKKIAVRLGARPERIASKANVAPGKWVGYCPHGNAVAERYRGTPVPDRVCLHAGRRFRDGLLWVNRRTGETLTWNYHRDSVEAAYNAAVADLTHISIARPPVISNFKS